MKFSSKGHDLVVFTEKSHGYNYLEFACNSKDVNIDRIVKLRVTSSLKKDSNELPHELFCPMCGEELSLVRGY